MGLALDREGYVNRDTRRDAKRRREDTHLHGRAQRVDERNVVFLRRTWMYGRKALLVQHSLVLGHELQGSEAVQATSEQ